MDDITLLSIDASAQRRAVLEPLLEMARECATNNSSNNNLSTIRTVVLKMLSHPKVFSGFDQFKREIQHMCTSLEGGDVLLRTLDLFSYGVYGDYAEAAPSQFLPLTQGQVQKLRQLTVVSTVQQSCLDKDSTGSISYDKLAQDLGFVVTPHDAMKDDDAVYRNVEEVVISCIYSRIISGRLCQRSKSVVIACLDGPPCQARDVRSVSDIVAVLSGLQSKLDKTITSLRQDKMKTQAEQEKNAEFWKSVTDANNKTMAAGQLPAPTKSTGLSQWQPETATASNTSRGRDAAAGGRPSSKRSRGGGTSISFQGSG